MGWDKEKSRNDRRTYAYVYFLRDPVHPVPTEKSYFQKAFNKEDKPHWLDAQRLFDGRSVADAMRRTNDLTVEEFLGIELPPR